MNDTYLNALLYVFLSAALLRLVYWWFFLSRLAFFKNPTRHDPPDSTRPPVSVIIVAHNEHDNLLHFLTDFLNQDYPLYEVIVVNDQSNDDSEFFIKSLQKDYKHLKLVNIKNPVNFFKGKKFPLSIGIKAACYEHLLLSDADCRPASPHWLKLMMDAYDDQTQIVLGYGAYQRKKGLLNLLIRYETFKTALSYLSFAAAGIPYMGVGRNLSYKKSLFFAAGGFSRHYKIPSGDDDLFINQVANKSNTRVVLNPEARTISVPKRSWLAWFAQKRRHLSTGSQYKKTHLIILGLNDLSYVSIGLSALALLYFQSFYWLIAAMLGLLYLSRLLLLKKIMKKLGEKKFLVLSPLLEIVVLTIISFLGMTNIFIKESRWK